MKLAFSTLGCPAWSLEQILENGQQMGFQAIEVRGVAGKLNTDEIPAFFPENRESTRAAFQAHGLKICDLATSVRFHDPEGLESALREGKSAIALCADMGIPYIRVFGDQVEKAPDTAGEVRRVAEGMRVLCRAAEGTPVTVLQEVHGQFNTVPRLMKMAEMVDSPHYGLIWDVAHSDTVYGDDFLAFYGPLRPLIRHVHLKDHRRLGNGAFPLCLAGEGDIPLRAIVERLEEDGYSGYYALEWEKMWHPDLAEPETVFPAYVSFMRGLGRG